MEERELALMQLSQILKDILTDRYMPKPMGTELEAADIPYFKTLAVRSLMYAMNELADGLSLEEDLKHSLVLYESDLARFHFEPMKIGGI